MSGYNADIQALEHDATECFAVWSDTLDGVLPSVRGDLVRSDFSEIKGSEAVWDDYQRVTDALATFLTDGSAVFDGFARRLLQTAQEYLRADGEAAAAIARLQSEIDDL
jgi:hypothetical protein